MKVAYFVNQYPKVSHTFIRREILALEATGVEISRFSLRSNAAEVLNPVDAAEAKLTQYILDTPLLRMLAIFLEALVRSPGRMWRTVALAMRIGRRSERGLLRHFVYVLEGAVLAKWSRREGASHIHAHFGTNSATVAMFASELSGLPFSFTAHGADEVDGAGRPDMAQKIKRAAFVVGVSAYVRSQLLRKMAYGDWGKLKIVHCGLDREFLQSPLTPVPADARLVCVGRLCEEKAQLLLVEAAGKLRARGVAMKLVLAGDGPLRPDIESLVKTLGLQDTVTITGWVTSERVKEELILARALVLPSLMEGLPVAIMEAMAIGRPVISTYISGIPELVISGETGWLVPAGDAEALADVMQRIIAAPATELERMGTVARSRVAARHDAATEAAKLNALFGDAGR